MRFEKIDVGHVEIIRRAASTLGFMSCQMAAAALYCYAEKYLTEVCVHNGFVFIKQLRPPETLPGVPASVGGKSRVCYLPPLPLADGAVGAAFDEIYESAEPLLIKRDGGVALDSALNELMEWHRSNAEGEFIIWGVADDMLSLHGSALARAGMTELSPERDWAEYIHTPENLINMKGKRFHAKKNAVNQFVRLNSDFGYEPLQTSNLDAVAEFQARLIAGVKKFDNDEKSVQSLIAENTAIARGLSQYEELKLKGGLIRIDGSVAAYAFGCDINPCSFDILFEKGLKQYNGIFQVLEQEMLKNNVSGYRYINREEDLGEEGLRFSKERLRPDGMLYKRAFISYR